MLEIDQGDEVDASPTGRYEARGKDGEVFDVDDDIEALLVRVGERYPDTEVLVQDTEAPKVRCMRSPKVVRRVVK